MEDKYIKLSDAKNALADYIAEQTVSKYGSLEACREARFGAEGAMKELDYVPTADVVPREDYDAVIAAQESLQRYIARVEKDLADAQKKIVDLYMEHIKSDEFANTICALYATREAEEIFGELDKILAFVIDDDVKVTAFDFSKYTEIKRRHIGK